MGLRRQLRELGEFTWARGQGPTIEGQRLNAPKSQTDLRRATRTEVRPRTPRDSGHRRVHDDGKSGICGETSVARHMSSKQK